MRSLFICEALLKERTDAKVRCLTCQRRCELAEGQVGWCRTRQNLDGTLYALNYGLISSISANPIEKKPLFHFYPGSLALTAGSFSCNFGCPWCQNWHTSKQHPPVIQKASRRTSSDDDHFGAPASQGNRRGEGEPGWGWYMSPEDFVSEARSLGCQGTSVSFNEPTLSLEWSLDVFRLARDAGLYNTYVTNGYMTPEALLMLVEAGLDGMNVDLKGDAEAVRAYCKGIDVAHVWRNCQLAREMGVHLEITTLVIPGVNDRRAVLGGIAERIVYELGDDVPWHLNRYYPGYRFDAPSTPVSILESGWKIGKASGLKFVYVGNVPGHRWEHTYCPECGANLIQRWGLRTAIDHEHLGRCSHCGAGLPGVWAAGRDD